MVPRFLEWVVKCKGKEGEPDEKESSDVSVVEDWHRTGEETFAGSEVVFEDGQSLVHLVLSDEMHRELFDSKRQIKKGTVGTVGSIQDSLGLLGFESLEKFSLEVFFVFPLGRKVALHGSNKSPGALREAI